MFNKFFGLSQEWETSARFAGQLSVEQALNLELQNEALVSGFQRSALAAALMTSGINALSDAEPKIGLVDFEPHLIEDVRTQVVIRNLLLNLEASNEEFIFATEFLANLASGRRHFQNFADDVTEIGLSRAFVIHRNQLRLSWRQTCRIGLRALEELDSEFSGSLPDIYTHNAQIVASLLTQSVNGRRPCIDADGRLFIPQLPQQRRWPRRAILQSCEVRYRDNVFPAFVRDVSAGGAGLERVPSMLRGTIVDLELECGRHLKGTVAWSEAPNAGIAFNQNLAFNDPMLMG